MIKNKNKYNSKDINSVKSRLVELSGINMNYVEFLDIYVNETETVHITIIDDFTVEDKLDVVFIHGLTGTSLYYYKCFVQLSKYMRIIALDLPGMGLSNRAFINYKKYNFEEAETFFVSRVDLALSKIGVDKFHFISHSFGGYISCLYYIHHPEKVLSMILLSPVGITSCYVEWISTPLEDLYQRVMYMFKKPPTEGYKIVPFADKILDKMLAHKLKYIKCDEEKEVFKDIVNFICKSTTTSEYLIYHFFNGTIQSYKPIIYYYEFFEKVKIDFIYGDRDWNPVDHAEEVLPSVDVHIVLDSGHILYCDNYDDLSRKILQIFENNKFIVVKTEDKMVIEKMHKEHLDEIIKENEDLKEYIEKNKDKY